MNNEQVQSGKDGDSVFCRFNGRDRGAGGARGASAPPPPPIISKNTNLNIYHRPQYKPYSNTSGKRSNVSLPYKIRFNIPEP